MAQALAGIRVLDFSHVLAGPIATHFLCQMGAEVTKVESGKGDTMRNYGGETFADGLGPSFVTVNTGKRSIVLDLKDPRHLAAVRKLVARADVVVENFRPGVIDRLGLGYEHCKAINPRLVFCSVSGFGQSGPLRENPAVDQIIQSMSGLMQLSGEPGSGPVRVGFPIVDTFSGLLAAFAIVTALMQREREGAGQFIDLAMLDASMVMMMAVAGPYLVQGVAPRKTGNVGYSKSPTADTFPTADGDITLGAIRQDQYEALCRVLERPDLVSDARYADRALRQRHAAALRADVIKALSLRTALDWEQRLNAAGVAAGAVRSVPQAFEQPQLKARGLTQSANLPDNPSARVLRAGFQLAHDGPGTSGRAPGLGEHTREVLGDLGYSADEIDAMLAARQAAGVTAP